jgi:outer membrane protein TolC
LNPKEKKFRSFVLVLGGLFKAVLGTVLLFPVLVHAEALRLDWVLEQVRQQNPEIRAAKAEAEAAKAMVIASRSWPDPQVGLEYWDFPRPGFNLGSADQRWLDFSQEIPFPAKTWLESGVAGHELLLKRAEVRKTESEQALQAKQAYWDLYAASASLVALGRIQEALRSLVALSGRRNRVGHLSRMEQLMDPMARMELTGLKNQALDLAQERLGAEARLKRLMGSQDPAGLADPPQAPGLPAFQMDEAALLQRSEQEGPDLEEARHHLLHTRAQRRLAMAGWMPDFMLQFSLVDHTGGGQTSMAMAKASLPFVWFWRQGSETAAAGREVDSAKAMLDSAKAENAEMVREELGFLKTARLRWANLRTESLPQAERALDLGLSGYRAGSLGVSDALGAVRAYGMAQMETLGTRAEIGRSLAALERLVGSDLEHDPLMEMSHEER